MRSVIAVVVVGILVNSAHADPFAVRNPLPATSAEPAPAAVDRGGDEVIDRGKSRRHAGLWTAVGGAGMVLGSLALSQYARVRYDAAVERFENGDPTAADEASRMHSLARWYGTGMFLTGAVAVGVGAYLYFTGPEKIRKERVAVVPAVGGDSLGAVVVGGF